jgi:conjugative transfer signal peptidase TraF
MKATSLSLLPDGHVHLDRPLSRFRTLLLAVLIAGSAIVSARHLATHFTFNLTTSMPVGLYWLSPMRPPLRGSAVDISPPASVRALIAQRAYLPPGCHLLKRVVAVAGDRVCTDGGLYVVNDQVRGSIATEDVGGRPLPRPFPFCGEVPSGLAFIAGNGTSSIDSRYFGPIPIDTLTTAVPVWTSY